ncbi:MAG TPA: hypothetical protein VMG10_12105 [Gemmataceae bacterium]|nr:hypothetical protein [Gemmataceae bacterium]
MGRTLIHADEDHRAALLAAIRQQRLLVHDALACGLPALYQSRRDRLRQLRRQLANLADEQRVERAVTVMPATVAAAERMI